jgi:carboxymethylenebutenolidase
MMVSPMPDVTIPVADGQMPAYIASPPGEGALDMSQDIRNQADWLASQGFLALAPDLFFRGLLLR